MNDILASHWPTTTEEAKLVQQQLRSQVIRDNDLGEVYHVEGVDVDFEDNGKTTRAAVAVLRFPELELVEKSVIRQATCFPYIPGYLSFRELPAVLAALKKLKTLPDLVLCDGQGIAHPRCFGLACHLGVITDLPSIGVAKSRLIGKHAEPAPTKGAWAPLIDKGETIRAVLRSRDNVRPLYISTGHRVDLPTAIDYVLRCTTRFRLPETTRRTHKLASG